MGLRTPELYYLDNTFAGVRELPSGDEEIVRIKLAKLYGELLNGPLGKEVLRSLKEGESFTLRSEVDMLLKVTKVKGKAVVEAKMKEDNDSFFRYRPMG